jgi:hypothetical protein
MSANRFSLEWINSRSKRTPKEMFHPLFFLSVFVISLKFSDRDFVVLSQENNQLFFLSDEEDFGGDAEECSFSDQMFYWCFNLFITY